MTMCPMEQASCSGVKPAFSCAFTSSGHCWIQCKHTSCKPTTPVAHRSTNGYMYVVIKYFLKSHCYTCDISRTSYPMRAALCKSFSPVFCVAPSRFPFHQTYLDAVAFISDGRLSPNCELASPNEL